MKLGLVVPVESGLVILSILIDIQITETFDKEPLIR